MDALGHRVKHALAVYLTRGEQALSELAAGDVEAARVTLRWRNAAFHNFRALDAKAQRAGFDVGQDPDALALQRAIAQVDRLLETALGAALGDAKGELTKVRAAKSALSRYRSRSGTSAARVEESA